MDRLSGASDAELVSRCLQRDADAWDALIRRYQRLIASITARFRLPEDDAADVFQSVSIALFNQLSTLNKESKLSSWLITVTVRECWKLRQKTGRMVPLENSLAAIGEASCNQPVSAEGEMLILERQHILRRAIESLSSPCRELIEKLFYSADPMSYAEISTQLGIPVASLGPTRGRCLGKLKSILDQAGFR